MRRPIAVSVRRVAAFVTVFLVGTGAIVLLQDLRKSDDSDIYLVFVSKGTIYATPWTGDAHARRSSLGRGIEPSFSRDGDVMAYSRVSGDEPARVCVAVIEHMSVLNRRCPFQGASPVVSPSGRFVAFIDIGIRVFDIVSGAQRVVVPADRAGGSTGIAWSPDESLLAVGAIGSSVRLIDARSGGTVRVLRDSRDATSLSWSRNGEVFAFSKLNGYRSVAKRFVDGVNLRPLLLRFDGLPGDLYEPALLSGHLIAVVRSTPLSGDGSVADLNNMLKSREIFVVDLDSTEIVRVTTNNHGDTDPTWWTPRT